MSGDGAEQVRAARRRRVALGLLCAGLCFAAAVGAQLGANRTRPQDRGAGILLHAKKGKLVKAGEPLFTLYADRNWRLQKAIEEGRRLMPVLVEGMLLDRVPSSFSDI